MRNISDLKENEVIHCRTQEEWDGVLKMFNPMGLKSGYWKTCEKESVIFGDGYCDNIVWAKSKNCTIYPHPTSCHCPRKHPMDFIESLSISKQIGEYTLLKHDGKIFAIKDSQAITLTTEIINAIKGMI